MTQATQLPQVFPQSPQQLQQFQQLQFQQIQAQAQDDDAIDLVSYMDLIFDHRWLIGSIALAVTLLGAAYAFMSKPIYEANILIQVEDNPNSSKNILGEMASMFDVKAAATAEMEILKSRMIVSNAVDKQRIYISAKPKYLPLIGAWIARRNKEISSPGLLGMGGYAWGAENIEATTFDVPGELQGKEFVLNAEGEGRYRLTYSKENIDLNGVVGKRLNANTDVGKIDLMVERLTAEPGAQFILRRDDRLQVIKDLQKDLKIEEKGKQSGVIGVSLQDSDPVLAQGILNEIGNEYVRQNVERKSEEAEKSLVFLDKQLPELKRHLEQAEYKLNGFRNKMGTVDLGEEAKLVLKQSIDTQTKLLELKQKRGELLTRQTNTHPDVIAVDDLIKNMDGEINLVGAKIKKLPLLEQEVLRLTRDVKVNTDLYTALLNSAQQLRLVRAGKVGNVRLVDAAVLENVPVKPKKAIVLGIAVMVGLFLGVLAAFVKKSLFGGVEDADEIEQALGLSVYATVPHSVRQQEIGLLLQDKTKHVTTLGILDPADPAIESLRSFRTALQFSMLDTKNNILLLTGPTPGLGKSFISVNLATILGAAGKKILLIDADLRKGYLHRYYSLQKHNGLSDLIVGAVSVEQAVHKDVAQNVDIISTGNLPPNPSELLAHGRFGELLQSLASAYDYVIIDSPPALVVADTMSIAPHAGSIFLTVRAGITTVGEIKETMKRLNQAGIQARGVLLNDLKTRPGRYGYGSKYGKYRYVQYKY
jgi:tyrosine-protein kinase Etk/Wzc